jgi:hypothetical protein
VSRFCDCDMTQLSIIFCCCSADVVQLRHCPLLLSLRIKPSGSFDTVRNPSVGQKKLSTLSSVPLCAIKPTLMSRLAISKVHMGLLISGVLHKNNAIQKDMKSENLWHQKCNTKCTKTIFIKIIIVY